MFFISKKRHEEIVSDLFSVMSELSCELFNRYTQEDLKLNGLRFISEGMGKSGNKQQIEYHFTERSFRFSATKKKNKIIHHKLLGIYKTCPIKSIRL